MGLRILLYICHGDIISRLRSLQSAILHKYRRGTGPKCCVDHSYNLLPLFQVKLNCPCAPNGVVSQNAGNGISKVPDSKIFGASMSDGPFSFSPESPTSQRQPFAEKNLIETHQFSLCWKTLPCQGIAPFSLPHILTIEYHKWE